MGSGPWKYRDLIGLRQSERVHRSSCAFKLSARNYAASSAIERMSGHRYRAMLEAERSSVLHHTAAPAQKLG
jgi:hypothetical protein